MFWGFGETLVPLEFSWRGMRFLWQRFYRGWDDSVLWDLHSKHTEYILPRLMAFRDHHIGYPAELTDERWNKILDEIIDAFELAASSDNWEWSHDTELIKANNKKTERGLRLFAKWYLHIWD